MRTMAERAPLTTLTATSLMNAFDVVTKWTADVNDGGLFWFRGVKDSRLDLQPGAYWRKDFDEYGPLLDFVQQGRAYADVGDLREWRTYYLAQHHGLPTRLLDWSESFSAALFFAMDGWDGLTTPVIWIVRPEMINKISVDWEGIISPEENKELDAWLPAGIQEGSKKIATADGKWIYDSALPLAIYPRKDNNRIVAQQGVFTIHGVEKVKLNEWIVGKREDHPQIICQVRLEGLDREKSMNQLQTLGLRRHTMYPDIDNFVSYLKTYYNW